MQQRATCFSHADVEPESHNTLFWYKYLTYAYIMYKGSNTCTTEKGSNKLIRHGRDTTKLAAKFNRM